MKIFIACLGTETNTFSPIPTGMEGFRETMLYRGDATAHPANLFSAPLHAWRKAGENCQAEIVESIAAFAQPAGLTVRSVYESLRDELLADLKRALPVDMVLLSMHGAMVANGYDDCEGDLLTRVRALAGPKAAIGGELDLHCSITPAMLEAADALITFKEYPHIDSRERAEELFAICHAKVAGAARPVMAVSECRMVSTWRTPIEPMKSFVAAMKAEEGRNGILSVSFAHGFPWGDVPHTSARIVVVADGDKERAAAVGAKLRDRVWAMRHETALVAMPIETALDRVQNTATGPVVIADIADNAGGGAPSDSTFVLRAILDRGIANVASGLYWDPVAVRFCKEAGKGASLDLRIGGKCSKASGDPVDLHVQIMGIADNTQQSFGDVTAPIGDAVWVRTANDVDLVLNSLRSQTFNPDAFTQFGIDLAAKKLIVVKSSQHFYAGFAPIATEVIYATTPGTLNTDFATIPYAKFTGPYWPRDADPFAA